MIKILILFSILSFLFSQEKILWDLGVIIKPKNNSEETNIIKPLISDTQITPQYKNMDKMSPFELTNTSLPSDHIIKLLYISERYVELTKYISKLSENGDVLNDNKIIVYSDALYRLGNYNEAIKNLAYLSEIYPADGKYFLLALYNKKLGNINGAVTFLDNLISDYPNSEYYKLAKLQTRILK